MMNLIDWIGSIGATCTTLAFVPQVTKIWRARSAKDVSLPMYAIFTVGVIFWLWYGVMLDSLPIIAANIITLLLALAIIGMKLKFD